VGDDVRAGRRPRRPVNRVDPEVRRRADELHSQGMPYQMAMAVAYGKLDLSEALERMATRDRVNRLMEAHELSRALATQIAIGHADLDQVLARRRLAQHREAYRERTCLIRGAGPLVLQLHGGGKAKGTIGEVAPYTFTLDEDGSPRELHKLELKYAYDPGDWKLVKKAVKADKRAAAEGRRPEVRPQDRYSCSDKRLFGYMDRTQEVVATLLDGDVVRGVVSWFGRYEFGMTIKGGAEITVFRHALRDLKPA